MSIQSVIESLQKSRESYKEKEQFLHRCRVELDYFVYSYLKDIYGSTLSAYWNTCTIPRTSEKAIVIVERRCHPNLQFTLQNAVYFARGYSLHIVCSEANLAFVQEVCDSQLSSIHIHCAFKDIGTVESGKSEYNTLLKTYSFWDTFKEDYLLCMETDSYLLRPLPDILCEYNYVASRWHWVPDQAGGGGLSHRKRSFMLEICTKPQLQQYEMQDTFASEGLRLLEYPILDDDLFCETVCELGIIGTHQWWTFVCSCPEEHMEAYLSTFLTLQI